MKRYQILLFLLSLAVSFAWLYRCFYLPL